METVKRIGVQNTAEECEWSAGLEVAEGKGETDSPLPFALMRYCKRGAKGITCITAS